METTNERNPLPSYSDLFRFISKNKTLQNKIDAVGAAFDLSKLSNAIAQGDYESPLLQHPDAHYACLKLFQLGKISSLQDASLFLYCLATKSNKTFKKTIPKTIFTANRNLSEYANTFIEHCVKPYFVRMQRKFELHEFIACIGRLPVSEQVFFELSFLPDTDFTQVLEQVPNFMGPIAATLKNKQIAILPSIGFLHTMFNLAQETPVSLYGFFGAIQPYTRHQLMRKEQRVPLARFEILVAHNLTEAHGWITDPFVIAFHDLLHWYWCNLLTAPEREEIFSYSDVLAQYYLEEGEALLPKAPGLVHLGKRVLETLWDFQVSFTQTNPEKRALEYLEEQAKSLGEYPIFQDWHPIQEALKWEKTYRKLAAKAPDPTLFCRIFPYREGVLDAYRMSLNLGPESNLPPDAEPNPLILARCFGQVCKLANQYGMVWLVFWFLTAHALPHHYPLFLEYIQENICAYSTISQLNSIDFSPFTLLPNQQHFMATLANTLETRKDTLADEDFCCEVLKLVDRYQSASKPVDYKVAGRIMRLILHAGKIHEDDFSKLAQIIMRHVQMGMQNDMVQREIFSLIPGYLNPEQLRFWQYFLQEHPGALNWQKLRGKIEKAARAYDVQELIALLAPPTPKGELRFFANPTSTASTNLPEHPKLS